MSSGSGRIWLATVCLDSADRKAPFGLSYFPSSGSQRGPQRLTATEQSALEPTCLCGTRRNLFVHPAIMYHLTTKALQGLQDILSQADPQAPGDTPIL